jgi:phage terminase large subunit-like protein
MTSATMNLIAGSSSLPPHSALKSELVSLLSERKRRKDRSRLLAYRPYSKQRDFHAAGVAFRERLLRAGNQLGKTYCGGAEVAYHLTGFYPDWWVGRRWDRPVRWWAGSKTGEVTRDGVQRILVGEPKDRSQWGTGLIPGDNLIDTASRMGVADALDSVVVQHVSGGNSTLGFKSYDQGREKWQGETLDGVWFDEEPPADIYTEGLTRTNATGGMAFLTFTPLLGMSEVVRRFLMEESPDRSDTNMVIDDAEHISPENRARIIASYPAHEREARARGVPILGSGRIFPVAESLVEIEPIAIPRHWPQIGGIDFGWTHPTAAVRLAWDRDADIVYVTHSYRVKEASPVIHAGALRPWGDWLPWSWPHDGNNDTAAGENLSKQYGDNGLTVLPERAQFADGSTSVEAGLMDMLDRMQTGRLRVFKHLTDWFDEFRLYHRADGKVVKEYDDLLCATRYALMMLRFADTAPQAREAGYASAGGWMG